MLFANSFRMITAPVEKTGFQTRRKIVQEELGHGENNKTSTGKNFLILVVRGKKIVTFDLDGIFSQ